MPRRDNSKARKLKIVEAEYANIPEAERDSIGEVMKVWAPQKIYELLADARGRGSSKERISCTGENRIIIEKSETLPTCSGTFQGAIGARWLISKN